MSIETQFKIIEELNSLKAQIIICDRLIKELTAPSNWEFTEIKFSRENLIFSFDISLPFSNKIVPGIYEYIKTEAIKEKINLKNDIKKLLKS